jgi:hypothetical protein
MTPGYRWAMETTMTKKRTRILPMVALGSLMALSAVAFGDYIVDWSCGADAEGANAGYDEGNSCAAWVNNSSASDPVSAILLGYEATCNEGSIPQLYLFAGAEYCGGYYLYGEADEDSDALFAWVDAWAGGYPQGYSQMADDCDGNIYYDGDVDLGEC